MIFPMEILGVRWYETFTITLPWYHHRTFVRYITKKHGISMLPIQKWILLPGKYS